MTCVTTRAGFQNYTVGDTYDTWCTCINTVTEPITDFFMETPIDLEKSLTVTTLLESNITVSTDH